MQLVPILIKIKGFKRNVSFRGLLNAFLHFRKINSLQAVDILYSCADNSRPVSLNGKYYSPLVDSINFKLKSYTNYTLALPFSRYSGAKCYGNTINLNLYIIVALLNRFTRRGSISINNVDNDPLIRFYERLFKKLAPKIIIGIQPSAEMCIAANRLSINVVDVQHGVIATHEIDSYYSLMKRDHLNNEGWPDYIFCRNEHSLKEVVKISDYTKPVLVGNLNKYFYRNIYKVKRSKMLFADKRKTILFTFQPFYESETFTRNNRCKSIIFPSSLLRLISNSRYNFILKLHPSQIQNINLFKAHISAFNSLFSERENIDFTVCNEEPLEYSLANSDLHITFNSASLFDAFDYGLHTILLDEDLVRLKRYFGDLMHTTSVSVDPNLEKDISNHFCKVLPKEPRPDFDFENFVSNHVKIC